MRLRSIIRSQIHETLSRRKSAVPDMKALTHIRGPQQPNPHLFNAQLVRVTNKRVDPSRTCVVVQTCALTKRSFLCVWYFLTSVFRHHLRSVGVNNIVATDQARTEKNKTSIRIAARGKITSGGKFETRVPCHAALVRLVPT